MRVSWLAAALCEGAPARATGRSSFRTAIATTRCRPARHDGPVGASRRPRPGTQPRRPANHPRGGRATSPRRVRARMGGLERDEAGCALRCAHSRVAATTRRTPSAVPPCLTRRSGGGAPSTSLATRTTWHRGRCASGSAPAAVSCSQTRPNAKLRSPLSKPSDAPTSSSSDVRNGSRNFPRIEAERAVREATLRRAVAAGGTVGTGSSPTRPDTPRLPCCCGPQRARSRSARER